MAATGPDPVSIRIVNPFNQWAPARPGFLEADGNYSPTTATVEVEIRATRSPEVVSDVVSRER